MPSEPEFHSPIRPPDAPDFAGGDSFGPAAPPTAQAYVALLAAWTGLLILLASIVFVFLPGTRNPRAELEGMQPYSLADRFLPIPMYGVAVALAMGFRVLWSMRKLPRPLPQALLLQRAQAWTGVVLALIGALVLYVDVALRMPR